VARGIEGNEEGSGVEVAVPVIPISAKSFSPVPFGAAAVIVPGLFAIQVGETYIGSAVYALRAGDPARTMHWTFEGSASCRRKNWPTCAAVRMTPRESMITPEPEIEGIEGSAEMHTIFTIDFSSWPPAEVRCCACTAEDIAGVAGAEDIAADAVCWLVAAASVAAGADAAGRIVGDEAGTIGLLLAVLEARSLGVVEAFSTAANRELVEESTEEVATLLIARVAGLRYTTNSITSRNMPKTASVPVGTECVRN
jgi:hypothetical protein